MSEEDAIEASIRISRRAKSWLAGRLGVSRSYFSEVTAGVKRMPEWMVAPLCALCGTTLLAQYRDLQRALRASEQREAEHARIDRIAAAARGRA
ncbi:hypothetical protein ACQQ2N_12250 [Dokdonella sp. MW10]|uniref:hypothetical protein n=1 Tax=Dokdonella sp. MW10 TaxID=2992926 RepID=UPI003F7D34E7